MTTASDASPACSAMTEAESTAQIASPVVADDPGPLVTAHAALVFLAATVVGVIVGGLTLSSTGSGAQAMLGALASAGVSTPMFHKYIGS